MWIRWSVVINQNFRIGFLLVPWRKRLNFGTLHKSLLVYFLQLHGMPTQVASCNWSPSPVKWSLNVNTWGYYCWDLLLNFLPYNQEGGWVSANYSRDIFCFSCCLNIRWSIYKMHGCVCAVAGVCSDVSMCSVPKRPRLYSDSSATYQCWLITALNPTASWTMLTPLMVPRPTTPG